jgi:hypothetical protein
MFLLAVALTYSVTFPAQENISVEITESPKGYSNLVFIAPHENEYVANDYLKKKINKSGGKFIQLKQAGHRLIELSVEQQKLLVDPNRIFTPLGRVLTLQKLNPTISKSSRKFISALAKTKSLAEFLLVHINSANHAAKNSWIAMHNNTNGYTGDGKQGEGHVSITRYQKKLAKGAKYISQVNSATHDEDDLFYVTQLKDFQQMSRDGWNVVLENPIVKTDIHEDDGSLSVYASKNGIRYINIEAERKGDNGGSDHTTEKQKMIDYIYSQF